MTAPWRAVGLFVLLTTCLSGIFWVLINATRPSTRLHLRVDVDAGGAAILTCRMWAARRARLA
jgi:hypothetical protein